MRNPYKKFQNSNIHVLKLCYASKSVTNGRTDGRKDGRTDEHPRSNMPLQLLWSWGHNKYGMAIQDIGFIENQKTIDIDIFFLTCSEADAENYFVAK